MPTSATNGVFAVARTAARTALFGVAATAAVSGVAHGLPAAEANEYSVSALLATAAFGDVSVSRSVAVSALSATATLGDVSVETGQSIAVDGLTATASFGDVSLVRSIAIDGLSASGSLGGVSVQTGSNYPVSALTAAGSFGDVSVDRSVAVGGLSATAALGDVSFETGQVVPVTALLASTTFGDVSTARAVGVGVLSSSASLGDVSYETGQVVGVDGLSASASFGEVSISRAVAVAGLASSATLGDVSTTRTAPVAGLAATTALGGVSLSRALAVGGVSATGSLGDVSHTTSGGSYTSDLVDNQGSASYSKSGNFASDSSYFWFAAVLNFAADSGTTIFFDIAGRTEVRRINTGFEITVKSTSNATLFKGTITSLAKDTQYHVYFAFDGDLGTAVAKVDGSTVTMSVSTAASTGTCDHTRGGGVDILPSVDVQEIGDLFIGTDEAPASSAFHDGTDLQDASSETAVIKIIGDATTWNTAPSSYTLSGTFANVV